MPTIDLPDDELAAAVAAIRRIIAGDRYPHAPRLDPLRAALARLEAATIDRDVASNEAPDARRGPKNRRAAASNEAAANPDPHPKAPPPAKADKRARR